jgi:hydroxymethylpyrimidine/phosphomethylpyrimidine kinase
VVSDIGVDAVKIGMLGTRETIACVEAALARLPQDIPVVVDPVLVATSGASLSEADTIPALHSLFARATVVTPNLPELDALGGEAAVLIHGCALLVKGGHAEGDRLSDRLVSAAGIVAEWEDSRIITRHTHGTGCTLASAIATGLGEGLPLEQAIARARKFVRAALRAAPGLGQGHGPMGHQAVRLPA